MPVETILVSGASGTVGSEVIRYLSSSTDVNFKAAARSVEKTKKNLRANSTIEFRFLLNSSLLKIIFANACSTSHTTNTVCEGFYDFFNSIIDYFISKLLHVIMHTMKELVIDLHIISLLSANIQIEVGWLSQFSIVFKSIICLLRWYEKFQMIDEFAASVTKP